MKKFSAMLMLIFLITALTGCRFAVVEEEGVQIGASNAALAEERPLKLNSRDRDETGRVHQLQERLRSLGYLHQKADGIFGENTQVALKAFQRDNGLEVTGVLDDVTLLELYPEEKALRAARADSLEVLEAVQSDVTALQEKMRQYGFSTELSATGEYDAATKAALEAFQAYAVKYYGTEFDDPLVLVEEPMLVPDDAPAATPTPEPEIYSNLADFPEMEAPTPEPTLRPDHAVDGVVTEDLFNYLRQDRFPIYREALSRGDAGDEVRRVQTRLYNLGYMADVPDGQYGEWTEAAIRHFQTRSGLQSTGIADVETQQQLFSADANGLENVKMPYYIKVSVADQMVSVYRMSDGEYSYLVKTMICSTGAEKTPTVTGVFRAPGQREKSRWHYFSQHQCWAMYAFEIYGPYLFHSVLFSSNDESTLKQSSLDALGSAVSHGCVRLTVEDARWIWENCQRGQLVEIG